MKNPEKLKIIFYSLAAISFIFWNLASYKWTSETIALSSIKIFVTFLFILSLAAIVATWLFNYLQVEKKKKIASKDKTRVPSKEKAEELPTLPDIDLELELDSLVNELEELNIPSENFSQFKSKLETRLKEYDLKLKELSKPTQYISENDQTALIETVKSKIQNLASDEILNDLKSKVSSDLTDNLNFSYIDTQFSNMFLRLKLAIAAQNRRGNLNLTLGITITIIGLGILGFFIANFQYNTDDLHFLKVFIPRFSLVILIEIFAYFFLKLYRSSLSETKFFQNELSNFESKYVALRIAYTNREKTVFEDILRILAKTERNIILQQGQSTLDLELQKTERDSIAEALKDVLKFLKSVKKL